MQAYLVWEHFSENDDRLRSGKQLCKTAPIPTTVDGVPMFRLAGSNRVDAIPAAISARDVCRRRFIRRMLSKCRTDFRCPITIGWSDWNTGSRRVYAGFDPYASTTQSRNLRVIESTINPTYKAKNDIARIERGLR